QVEPTRLFLLLVDYASSIQTSQDVARAEQAADPRYPQVPFLLPATRRLTQQDLNDWLGQEMIGNVLDTLAPHAPPLDMADFFQDTQDELPQIIYNAICTYCQLSPADLQNQNRFFTSDS